MFITFEGPDGSGKSTALESLTKYLDSKGIEYVLTREPGGANSDTAERIRKVILDPRNNITPMTEAILYAADRRQNLELNIWPALKEGKLVICDRYIDSTFAYQGFGRELGFENMIELQDSITEKTYPDLTFFFDLSPEESAKRLANRSEDPVMDRLELAGKTFHEKVYKGYQEVIKRFPERISVINADLSRDEVYEQVKKIFNEKYKG